MLTDRDIENEMEEFLQRVFKFKQFQQNQEDEEDEVDIKIESVRNSSSYEDNDDSDSYATQFILHYNKKNKNDSNPH